MSLLLTRERERERERYDIDGEGEEKRGENMKRKGREKKKKFATKGREIGGNEGKNYEVVVIRKVIIMIAAVWW